MSKNVLWITTDEFRADALGAMGNAIVQTPHLDRLAKEGVMFTQAYCQCAPCAPSRMSMHTGRYMCSTGTVDNMTPLLDAEDNLAFHLRRHGYLPLILGYNDYACNPSVLPEAAPGKDDLSYEYFLPGFDVVLKHEYDSPEWYAWLEEQGYPKDLCNRETMYSHRVPPQGPGDHLPLHYPAYYKAEHSEARFMTLKAIDAMESSHGRPWFMNINYIKPHGPYICPEPYHAMYDPMDMPSPLRHETEAQNNHPYLSRCRNDWAQTELREERDWRELRACYYGMVSELDACLGQLFAYLRASGLWDSTLIIFNADHGSYLGDHYLAGKPHYFDAAMHVPLIIRDPDGEADGNRGTQRSGFVEGVDIAPTICQYLGIPAHPRFQGTSILDAIRGRSESCLRDEIHYEFYYYNLLRNTDGVCPEACRLWVVRSDRYKYVQFGEKEMPSQLFDLRNDPGEFENLAQHPDYAGIVAEYCQRLIRWRIRNEEYRMEQWARQYR